jgi:hypothetical protein
MTAFDPAILSTYATEGAALLVGIGTGIIIHAKLWWKSKTTEERKAFVYDAMQSLEDGKITAAEAKALIKAHL